MSEISVPILVLATSLVPSAGAGASYGGIKFFAPKKSGDFVHGGSGFIPGTVKLDSEPVDIPLRRRVRLHRDVDGLPVRETWSDPVTGEYIFTDINPAIKYTVISYDHTRDKRAVAADNITPEVLP